MAIHIVTEPEYAAGTWYDKILQGVQEQAKQKRIDCLIQNGDFYSENIDLILLAGNDPAWIQETLKKLSDRHNAHIILVSKIPYQVSVSNISADFIQSMRDILSYLENDCQRHEIAFYGANPHSTTDLLKREGFPWRERIYFNDCDLRSCFQNFYQDIHQYDAVICANDYAAVSLLQNLKKHDPQQLGRLFIVSFANTHISSEYTPSITSVVLNYYEYGRTAVNIYLMLLKNPQISAANISINSRIIPRATTREIPFTHTPVCPEISDRRNNGFFDDPEIRELGLLEHLLSIQDDTDAQIIRSLLEGCSYEQIAQMLFMSVNGIKYRINRLLKISGIKNRKHLVEIYNRYFEKTESS